MRTIRIFFLFSILWWLQVCPSMAQNIFMGQVVDEVTKRPIHGATVRSLYQSEQIWHTNIEGRFRIEYVNLPIPLEVSHVGYERRKVMIMSIQDTIFSLQPLVEELDEVVVSTGYQQLPMERATGSFEVINSGQISRMVGSNLMDRLENMSSSLFYDNRRYDINGGGNEARTIMMRGVSTLRSSVEPLIVLDNFPYEGDIQDINPDDISQITLLKDAAATSIWGAKAGNGVIVISTKKGKENQRITSSFSGSLSLREKPNLWMLPMISPNTYVQEIEPFLFRSGFYLSYENDRRKTPLTPGVESLIAHRDGVLTDAALQAHLEDLGRMDVRRDFLEYIYRQGRNRQYSYSISGGSPNHTFNSSIGYDVEEAEIKTTDKNRISFQFSNRYRLNPKLSLSSSLRYVLHKYRDHSRTGKGIGYGDVRIGTNNLYPYARFIDAEGNALSLPVDHRSSYLEGVGDGLLLDWQYRILEEAEKQYASTSKSNILLGAEVGYEVLPFLKWVLMYQYQQNKSLTNEHFDEESYYVRNLVNRFTQISNGTVIRPVPLGGILNKLFDTGTSHQGRTQLNVDKKFNDTYHLYAIAGFEARDVRADWNTNRIYGYQDDIYGYAGNIDHSKTYPIFDNLSGATFIPAGIGMGETLNRFVSVFGNASFIFSDRYILSGSARKDASNLFGVRTNQRWTPLWSTGMSWIVNKEPFYQNTWMPDLKLRMSYGFSGNVDHTSSAFTTLHYTSSTAVHEVYLRYASILNPPNPDLKWEKVGTFNFGADFSLFGRRVTGSVDYYIKKTKDLMGRFTLDQTVGINNIIMNVASTKGHGVDVSLSSRLFRGSWAWTTSLNASYSQTKVTKQYQDYTNSTAFMSRNITPVDGYDVYPMFSYKWHGLDPTNGNPIGEYDGELSQDYSVITRTTPVDDLVYHGSQIPLYFGNLLNEIRYHDFGLSFNISCFFDYYFKRPSFVTGSLTHGNVHSDYYDRWMNSGDELKTAIPSLSYPIDTYRDQFYSNSQVLVERGDHVRLKDIRIMYSLKSSRVFQDAQLYFMGSNLGVIWTRNKQGLDPMVRDGISVPRFYSMGFNFKF